MGINFKEHILPLILTVIAVLIAVNIHDYVSIKKYTTKA
jgi:purine-cytosine permease-like protein